MSGAPPTCVLALDLGTTAFKAGAVGPSGLLAPPAVVRYRLDSVDGAVTCDAGAYRRAAFRALAGAARAAHERGVRVAAVGVSSQAQTFVVVGPDGRPAGPAIVWTDARAAKEAAEAAGALPDFAVRAGWTRPSAQQLLPKAMALARSGRLPPRPRKLLLLNEYILLLLTGRAFGDQTNQGMGGLFDIRRRAWWPEALRLAGLEPQDLAEVAPAAAISAPLSGPVARRLGLAGVPACSCGNDQSAAAAGADLASGAALCNLGTAMVVFSPRGHLPVPSSDGQAAGIHALTDRGFLLGFESECGNVMEWLLGLLYPRLSTDAAMALALAGEADPRHMPRVAALGGGRIDLRGLTVGCSARDVVRGAAAHYAARLDGLLEGVAGAGFRGTPHVAAGGLARGQPLLDLVEREHGIRLVRAATEHLGLIGIARILARAGLAPAPHPEETAWSTASST